MKYCCISARKWRRNPKRIRIGVALILTGTLILLICVDGFVRAVIRGYPMSVASGVMLDYMDKAMQNVMKTAAFDASKVDRVIYGEDGQVLSIETDTVALTGIKTSFAGELNRLLNEYGNTIRISVPLGTLIGNEYTIGRGPKISFRLQYSWSVTTDLESSFGEAGINNSLHTITMNVTNHLFIVIPWGNSVQDVSTEYILAETVIVGKVPEAYTNVYDGAGDVVDDLFNYGAELD